VRQRRPNGRPNTPLLPIDLSTPRLQLGIPYGRVRILSNFGKSSLLEKSLARLRVLSHWMPVHLPFRDSLTSCSCGKHLTLRLITYPTQQLTETKASECQDHRC
jgi:hypothetical protein